MTEEELVKERQARLETFVRSNWDIYGPQAIEECDDAYLYTGAVLVLRSREMTHEDTEVILKVHTGLGFSEQVGLLETAVAMMHADHTADL